MNLKASIIILIGLAVLPGVAAAGYVMQTDFESEDLDAVPSQWFECEASLYSVTPFPGTGRVSDALAFSGSQSLHLNSSQDGTSLMCNLVPATMLDPDGASNFVIEAKVHAETDEGNFAFNLGQHWFDIGCSFEQDRFFAVIEGGAGDPVAATLVAGQWYMLRLVIYPQQQTFDLSYSDGGAYLPVYIGKSYSPNRLSGFLSLRTNNDGPTSVFVDDVSILIDDPVSIGIDEPGPGIDMPERGDGLAIEVVPNPFNPRTEIIFELARPGRAAVRVHDLSGRLVDVIEDRGLGRGEHRVFWEGTDAGGRRVASGTYIVSVLLDGRPVASRHVTLLK